MPNIAEALMAVDTARSSREREDAMTAVVAHLDRAIDYCERLGWFDIAHDLQGTKARLTKRRRNVTRH